MHHTGMSLLMFKTESLSLWPVSEVLAADSNAYAPSVVM